MERAKIPSCDACEAYDENPHDYVETEICPSCPWQKSIFNPRLDRLLFYMALSDSPCRVGRHELTNMDWIALGTLRAERDRMAAEGLKKK
jgi:hypothetical protein